MTPAQDTPRTDAMIYASASMPIDLCRQLERELSQAVKVAGEALEFYAETRKYLSPKTGGLGELYFDCGERAKRALSKLNTSKP